MIKTIRITGKQQAWLETFQEHQNLLVNCCSNNEDTEVNELTFRFSARPKTVSYEDTQVELINNEIEHFKKVLTPSMHGKLKALFNDDFVYAPRTRRTTQNPVVAAVVAAPVVEVEQEILQESDSIFEDQIPVEDTVVANGSGDDSLCDLVNGSYESPDDIFTPEVLEVLCEVSDVIKSEIPESVLAVATDVVNRIETAAVAYAKLFNKEPSDYPIDERNKSYYKICRQIVDVCNAADEEQEAAEEEQQEEIIIEEKMQQYQVTSNARGNFHRDVVQRITVQEYKTLTTSVAYYQASGCTAWPDPDPTQYILVDEDGVAYPTQSIAAIEAARTAKFLEEQKEKQMNKPVPVTTSVVAPIGLTRSAVQEEIEMKQRQASPKPYLPTSFAPETVVVEDYANHNHSDEDIMSARRYVANMQKFLDEERGGPNYVMPEHMAKIFAAKKEIAKCLLTTEKK